MKIATVLLACCVCLTTSCESQAGGMFRRIPEVGEWASYEVTGQMTRYIDGKEVVEPGSPGMLTIKCVGEETIDGVRHLWIEAVSSHPELQRPGTPTVLKYLVAEDEVVNDIATCDFERGWFQLDGLGIQAFEREEPQFGAVWANVLGMLPHMESPIAAEGSKMIAVEGKEVELRQTETGLVHEFNDPVIRARIAIDCTMWTSEDLAFGVASVEQTVKATLEGELFNEMQGTFNLVATGTGAVSELPDHN
jgi:hypothetical protein